MTGGPWQSLAALFASPLGCGVLLAAAGLALLSCRGGRAVSRLGLLLGLGGLATIGAALPAVGDLTVQVQFWLMAGLTLCAAAGTVAARDPLYAAVSFALCLLGVAGLMLLRQASFVGVATIAVYAGAIVVMFLFVLMLAQPEGQSAYDRLTWSAWALPGAALIAALFVGLLARAVTTLAPAERPVPPATAQDNVTALGTYLFSRHLLEVEIVGTVLLAALVGAVAIVIHGKTRAAAGAVPSRGGARP